MKNIVMFPGTATDKDMFWYPWLAQQAGKAGVAWQYLDLPGIDDPELEPCLRYVTEKAHIDEDSILVGHSSGSALILATLEKKKAAKALLVGGYARHCGPYESKMLKNSYDWVKIKANCPEFFFFNSPDDPWGCDDKQGRIMFDELGGTLVIRNDGHYGSIKFDQPYREFPLLWKMISS